MKSGSHFVFLSSFKERSIQDTREMSLMLVGRFTSTGRQCARELPPSPKARPAEAPSGSLLAEWIDEQSKLLSALSSCHRCPFLSFQGNPAVFSHMKGCLQKSHPRELKLKRYFPPFSECVWRSLACLFLFAFLKSPASGLLFETCSNHLALALGLHSIRPWGRSKTQQWAWGLLGESILASPVRLGGCLRGGSGDGWLASWASLSKPHPSQLTTNKVNQQF